MSRMSGMTKAQIAGQKALAAAASPKAGKWVLKLDASGLPSAICRGGVKVLVLANGSHRNKQCAEYVVELLNAASTKATKE